MNTTMRLKDYGYNIKKNAVLRETSITRASREKGYKWVNIQLKNMLRVANENESIVLFKDKCNFIGSSPVEVINNTMKDYESVLNNNKDHTEFLDYAVIELGWRNVYKWLEYLKYIENDEKNAEKIKKDMDYVTDVHSHRKKVMEQMAREKEIEDEKQGEQKGEEQGEQKGEQQGKKEKDISLREYGYAVYKTQNRRIEALQRAVACEGMELVCARLEKLGQYNPVMLEDLKKLTPFFVNEEHSHQVCTCVSSQEIRKDLSKVNDLKEVFYMIFKLGVRKPSDICLKMVQDAVDVVMKNLDEEDKEYMDYVDSWNQKKNDMIIEFAELGTQVKDIVKKYKDIMVPVGVDGMTDWNHRFKDSQDKTRTLLDEIDALNNVTKGKQLHSVENVEKLREQRRTIRAKCEELLVELRKVQVLNLQELLICGGC